MIYGRFIFTAAEIDILAKGVEHTVEYAETKLAELRAQPRANPAEIAFYEGVPARTEPYRVLVGKLMMSGKKIGLTEAQIQWLAGSISHRRDKATLALLDKLDKPFRDDKSQDAEPEDDE